jgi:hypothetical protein
VTPRITQDDLGTHLEWELEGITPRMIDWFWSNMEKGFVLWHPSEHEPLSWAVPVMPGNIVGAVHLAPQTWSDGTFRNLYIRFEDPATLAPELQGRIVLEHCIVAAGLGFRPESLEVSEPMGYRVHVPETPEEGLVWAKHCAEEIGNWAAFLPQLYGLYRVVDRPELNPFADLTVDRDASGVHYRNLERR